MRTVLIEDEDGQMIERILPKSEFRKKIAFFFFENESGDTSLDYLRHGIINVLYMDLIQDHYIDVATPFLFFDDLKKAGFPEGVGIPLTLKRKIATDHHKKYFY